MLSDQYFLLFKDLSDPFLGPSSTTILMRRERRNSLSFLYAFFNLFFLTECGIKPFY